MIDTVHKLSTRRRDVKLIVYHQVEAMKQRVRAKRAQRRHAQWRGLVKLAAAPKGRLDDGYEARLDAIYHQHKKLFDRLANA